MKSSATVGDNGFTMVEVLLVMAIVAMLASIAISNYAVNKEQAKAATCLANRRTIEKEEAAHYAQHLSPSLTISNAVRCPGGGVYVWLVSDPDDPDYPRVACSIHYAGTAGTAGQTTDGSSNGETDGSSTGETTEPPSSPDKVFEELIDYIKAIPLPNNVKKKLLNAAENAQKDYDQNQSDKSDKRLDNFKKQVDKNSKKIDDRDEAALIEMTDKIQEMLRQL